MMFNDGLYLCIFRLKIPKNKAQISQMNVFSVEFKWYTFRRLIKNKMKTIQNEQWTRNKCIYQ